MSKKDWRVECPLLVSFLNGAMQNNSGSTFQGDPQADEYELSTAEEQLMVLCDDDPAYAHWLGAKADEGYTTVLPKTATLQTSARRVLMCYTILDREY